MATKKLFFLFSILLNIVGTKALAYDIAVENADGVTIYYNYINDGKELEVTYNNHIYSGSVVIPEEVTYMNRTRKVTSIGWHAFSSCYILTSITIPNSVRSIGEDAFSWCYSLTSITFPNSVTTIGAGAFYECSDLASITIGNSLTSIGQNAFKNCHSLTSVHISDLESWCKIIFDGTYSNPLYYAHHLFLNGSEIKDLIIPNSVTSIGAVAFRGCSGLTSVTIPNYVTSIGYGAFDGCDLPIVISKIENPFIIRGKSDSDYRTFSLNTFNNATLYVPVGTTDKYKSTEGWKDFAFIEEGTGGGDTPTEPKKCEKPTISYSNGKLTFNCSTEGAICQSSITDADITSYNTNEIQLGVTYNISVYATKTGYENSETATATLCWIDVEPKTEGIDNGIAQVRANAVMFKTEESQLTIEGVDDNTNISVYTLDGVLAGSAISKNGVALVNTNITNNSIAIVKIGEKSFKVHLK